MSTQWNPDAKSSTTTTRARGRGQRADDLTHPGMSTYYRNSRGRVVVVNPFPVVEFWHMTHEAIFRTSSFKIRVHAQGRRMSASAAHVRAMSFLPTFELNQWDLAGSTLLVSRVERILLDQPRPHPTTRLSVQLVGNRFVEFVHHPHVEPPVFLAGFRTRPGEPPYRHSNRRHTFRRQTPRTRAGYA